jgi:hypothetical protein
MSEPASLFDLWSPVTQDFGLVRGPLAEVAEAYRSLFDPPPLRLDLPAGGAAEAFQALPPLTHAMSRALFLATASDWVAFFRNGTQGSDPFMPMWHLARRHGYLSMRVCCMPQGARWPAVIWEVYAPPGLGGDADGRRRSIAASHDGGRWTFHESGDRFAFERHEAYGLPRKRDRFTRAMLLDYLREFGIPGLDDGLFAEPAAGRAILVHDASREGRLPAYSLDEVRRGLPWMRGA